MGVRWDGYVEVVIAGLLGEAGEGAEAHIFELSAHCVVKMQSVMTPSLACSFVSYSFNGEFEHFLYA